MQRAAKLEIPVSSLVSQALERIVGDSLPVGFVPLGPSTGTAQQAGEAIREIAMTHTLNGLKIKDLIEEGRRL